MASLVNRLQFKHFRLIQAISNTGQLSLAADRLGMTQPAASRSLAEIEKLLGETAFYRHPKGMTPTTLGEVLVRRGNLLLGDLDEAAQEVESIRGGRAGVVRVGAVTGAAVGYIVPAIQALKREAKEAEIQVAVSPSSQLMEDLLGGDLDFILSRVPPGVDGRHFEILQGRTETIRFLVRTAHPLTRQQNLDLEDLTKFPWIIQERGMPIREAVDAAHIAAGVALPTDVIDSASLVMTIAYVRSSDSISPVAHEVAAMLTEAEATGFSTLDRGDEIVLSPYHLFSQRGRALSPIADRLLEMVRKRLAT